MLVLGVFCFTLWGYNFGQSVPFFMRASLPHVMTISAKVGDNIKLDCSSDGQPHPEIIWYKYNVPLFDITYRRLEDTIKSGKLVLSNILLADAGNYSCHVNNTLGSISRTFQLYVYESSNSRPMIVESLMTNKTAALGGEASFHCHVTSNSVIYVRWYFKRCAVQVNASDNSTQAPVTEIRSIVPVKVASFVQGNGSNGHLFKGEAVFLVKNVSLHDEGEYICEAFNEHGKVRCGAFLVVVEGPTPSAHEIEARYAALFGKAQELPLAVLVAIPVAFLIVLTAVFIRALEKAKQKHGLVKKTDMNGDAVVMSKTCSAKESSTNQKVEKEIVSTEPRRVSNYTKRNGVQTGQQITQFSKQVTCAEVRCSSERLPSSQASYVSSKRCSAALELEWEGIELVMEDGFEMIKLCKEEEV